MAQQVKKDKIQIEIEINGEKRIVKSIGDLKLAYKQLNQEIQLLDIGSDAYIKKQDELRKIKALLDEQRITYKKVGTAIEDASKQTVGWTGNVKILGRELVLATAGMALIGQGVAYLVDLARETLNAAAGFTELNGRINQLTGLTGGALRKAASDAKAIADTFGVDVNDGINAANATAQAFAAVGADVGPTFQKSLGLIEERLALLGDKGGDFLDILQEYSVQAVSAGISVERFYNLAAEGINRGIPTDKLLDSVKEFDIRIKTETKGQADTLNKVLGKAYSEDLVKAVEAGSKSSFQALQEVSMRLIALGPQSADAKKVLSELFGGAGEDAVLFAQVIADTGDSFDSLTGSASAYTKRQLELLKANKDLTTAQNELNFALGGADTFWSKLGITLKTGFSFVLAQIATTIRYFPDYFAAAGNGLLQFVNGGIVLLEQLVRVGLGPVLLAVEAISGKKFELPKFDTKENAFLDVQAKIAIDRANFAKDEAARQAAEAKRLAKEKADAEAAALRPSLAAAKAASEAQTKAVIEVQKVGQALQQDQALSAQEELNKQALDLAQKNELDKAQIQKDFLALRLAQEQDAAIEAARLQEELDKKKYGLAKQQVTAFYNAINALVSARIQRQYDDQIERLDATQERELLLAGDNEKKKAEIEAKFAKQKEAAEKALRKRQQQQAVIQTLINTAVSIVKTGAELGYPAAIPFQVIAGIIGGIQAAAIASQKYERGGMLEDKPRRGRGGLFRGPRHRDGGVKMYANGQLVGEAEGGEPILSRQTYANNRAVVDALLYSSMHQGGKKVFASGGILDTPSTTPSASDIATAQEFNDANIVRELRNISQGIGNIQLRIGEREAATIADLDRRYQSRKSTTRL